jgi:hemoglobin
LGEHTYKGTPFLPHAPLPIHKEHFDIWLRLFHHTLDEYFVGDKAAFAKKQSNIMAMMFQHKLDIYRSEMTN